MGDDQPQATSNKLQDLNNQQAIMGTPQTKKADEVIDQILTGNRNQQPAISSQQTVVSSQKTTNSQIPPADQQASVDSQQTTSGSQGVPLDSGGSQSDQVVAQSQLGVSRQMQPPQQPAEPVSVPQKEVDVGRGEAVPLVELKEDEKIPEDVQRWVEKLQKEEVRLPEPVKDGDRVVLAEPNVTFKDDKIVLPVTQSGYAQDMKQKVTESARWLATWVGRLIKMFGDRAKFRGETTTS